MSKNPFFTTPKECHDEESLRQKLQGYFLRPSPFPEPFERSSVAWYASIQSEAILNCEILGKELPSGIDAWHDICTFGEGTPTLEILLRFAEDSAVAFFPTCSERGGTSSRLYRLYVIHSQLEKDHRKYLSSVPSWLDGYSLYVIDNRCRPLSTPIDGNSWLLCAQFAKRVISERSTKLKQRLAIGCLFTGGISDDENEILQVQINNKTDIFTMMSNHGRKIMVPSKNQEELKGLSGNLKNMQYPSSMTDAWRWFIGTGFENARIQLPKPLDSLHIVVGENIRPALIPVLLLKPGNVTLWHSMKSQAVAGQVNDVMSKLCPDMKISLESMSSSDMDSAYRTLKTTLAEEKQKRWSLLVSITGGNRLMGYAAYTAGQDYDITLVYRDINALPDELTAIRKESNGIYLTDQVKIEHPAYSREINWELLYSREKVETETVLSQLFLN